MNDSINASQFFIVGFKGPKLTHEELNFFAENPVGGAILFSRNIQSLEQLIALNTSLIEANAEHPPLVCVDQEGGRVARLRNICTPWPAMATLKDTFVANPQKAYQVGADLGRQLVALGFHLDFAPVCDVNCNPQNQVIGDRAFSDDPSEVGLFAGNMIRGMQDMGLAACAKHFPGHGDTHVDSHEALPTILADAQTFSTRDLLPFKSAIGQNVATIMTAHIKVPSLDQEWPATLSKTILTDLLREQLGYNQVIISDDLDMKAMDKYDLPTILEQGLRAGVDLFIIGNNFAKSLQAVQILQNLLDQKPDLQALAAQSLERIQRLRKRYIGAPAAPTLEYAQSMLHKKSHLELLADSE